MMNSEYIKNIVKSINPEVIVVAAAKWQSLDKVLTAVDCGINIIGENYVQEAEKKYPSNHRGFKLHMIGHLQKNKVKRAVNLFDCIQTLDSLKLAKLIDKEAKAQEKIIEVMLEVNIAKEEQKNGINPEDLFEFVKQLKQFSFLKPVGIMTMGPFVDNPETLRPYFKQMKELFEKLKKEYSEYGQWQFLSMGMSDSYRVAIEEGANMVRLGTVLFGTRNYKV